MVLSPLFMLGSAVWPRPQIHISASNHLGSLFGTNEERFPESANRVNGAIFGRRVLSLNPRHEPRRSCAQTCTRSGTRSGPESSFFSASDSLSVFACREPVEDELPLSEPQADSRSEEENTRGESRAAAPQRQLGVLFFFYHNATNIPLNASFFFFCLRADRSQQSQQAVGMWQLSACRRRRATPPVVF